MNAQTVVEAYELDPAAQIESAQRRSFFRVATAGAPLEPVQIHPQGTGDESVDGSLVNISAGGIGVSVVATPYLAKTLPRSRMYDCTISLPSLDDPITLTAKLVHFQVMGRLTLYLGLQFQFGDEKQRREVEDHIARFNAYQQRKQLRWQRGTVQ